MCILQRELPAWAESEDVSIELCMWAEEEDSFCSLRSSSESSQSESVRRGGRKSRGGSTFDPARAKRTYVPGMKLAASHGGSGCRAGEREGGREGGGRVPSVSVCVLSGQAQVPDILHRHNPWETEPKKGPENGTEKGPKRDKCLLNCHPGSFIILHNHIAQVKVE